MKNKKYILLDLDGTLTDSSEGIINSVKYALEKQSAPIPPMNVLRRFIGPPLIDAFQEYTGLTYENAELAVKTYRERYKDIGLFENRVYDGIIDFLEALKNADKTIILATCKPKVFADRILEHFGLTKYFAFTVGPEFNGRLNYKHEVIKEVMKLGNITDRSLMVMIGDRHHDIDGAKYHSISSIGVSFGFAEEGELEKAGADMIADSPKELTDILI